MELSVKTLKQIDVITASGRIDSSNAAQFEGALKSLQERGRHKLVLDFSNLEYISSAGLRAMVGALKVAKSHNGNVILVNPNARIRDTISLVGFQSLFPHYEELLEAVDVFS